jgi:hypothetical protein
MTSPDLVLCCRHIPAGERGHGLSLQPPQQPRHLLPQVPARRRPNAICAQPDGAGRQRPTRPLLLPPPLPHRQPAQELRRPPTVPADLPRGGRPARRPAYHHTGIGAILKMFDCSLQKTNFVLITIFHFERVC